jgi:pilus assembly protein CpaC
MRRGCTLALALLAVGCLSPAVIDAQNDAGDSVQTTIKPSPQAPGSEPRALSVLAGKSILIDSPAPIERVSVGYGDIAEATAVAVDEVLLNGKTPGVTSFILWLRGGGKLMFDVTVRPSNFNATMRAEAVERELRRELPGQDVSISYENETVFLRGRVKDLVSADRAVSIASTLGKTVNLLYVDVPDAEPQVLLKVRFATVDRSASLQLGLNLASTGAANTIGAISTQQFSPPQVAQNPGGGAAATISDALNVFLFRPDLNLLTTISALEQKSLLEILAEPNVLATNGKTASFLAGGEFPYPTFQASTGGGTGAVTIQFQEFGVRLDFTPVITARGTVRLRVAPEVSALDFTSGLVVQGFNVPALTVRKVNTEIELAPGQSFAIGGLLDNRLTDTISKIPFAGDIPVLGKLFQSKSQLKQNTELIVIVTPELVNPVPGGEPVPGIEFPRPVEWQATTSAEANTPAGDTRRDESIPLETLMKTLKPIQPTGETAATSEPAGSAASGPALPSAPPPK